MLIIANTVWVGKKEKKWREFQKEAKEEFNGG